MTRPQLSDQIELVSQTLKLLAHPIRLGILCEMIEGPQSVGVLAQRCGASQSYLSQSLARMKERGLIDCTKKGTTVFYRISDPKIRQMISSLHRIYCRQPSAKEATR